MATVRFLDDAAPVAAAPKRVRFLDEPIAANDPGPGLPTEAGMVVPEVPADTELDTFYRDTTRLSRIADPLKAGVAQVRQGSAALGADVSSRALRTFDTARSTEPGAPGAPMGGMVRVMRDQRPEEAAATRETLAGNLADSASRVVEQGRTIAEIPQNPAARRMGQAKTWGEAASEFWRDPIGVIQSIGLQSAPASVPGLVTGVITGPVGGGAVMGGSSFLTEYASSVLETLGEDGINLADRDALVAAFQNPDLMEKARAKAALRGGIVGAVDAATMGLASRTLAPRAITSPLAREAANIPAQTVAQGIAGGGAEAAAQLATEGKISQPGQVLAEVAGEAVGAPVEVASLAAHRQPRVKFLDEPRPAAPPGPGPSATDLKSVIEDDRSVEEIMAEREERLALQQEHLTREALVDQVQHETGDTAMAEAFRKALEGKGARVDPMPVDTGADVDAAAAQVEPEPTPAQAEAGNYRKGHVRIHGLNIAIETARGDERTGIGADGQPWSNVSPAHYGYIKRTKGKDGDQVDVYVGDNPQSDLVTVVDQIDPETGRFDEHKVVLGTDSRAEAVALYDAGFSDGTGSSRRGAVTTMTVPEFKAWLAKGDTKKPLAYRPAAPAASSPAVEPAAPPPAPASQAVDPGAVANAIPIGATVTVETADGERDGTVQERWLRRGMPHARVVDDNGETIYAGLMSGITAKANANDTPSISERRAPETEQPAVRRQGLEPTEANAREMALENIRGSISAGWTKDGYVKSLGGSYSPDGHSIEQRNGKLTVKIGDKTWKFTAEKLWPQAEATLSDEQKAKRAQHDADQAEQRTYDDEGQRVKNKLLAAGIWGHPNMIHDVKGRGSKSFPAEYVVEKDKHGKFIVTLEPREGIPEDHPVIQRAITVLGNARIDMGPTPEQVAEVEAKDKATRDATPENTQFSWLYVASEGRWSTKDLTYTSPSKWLLEQGYGVADKKGKVTLTEAGWVRFAELARKMGNAHFLPKERRTAEENAAIEKLQGETAARMRPTDGPGPVDAPEAAKAYNRRQMKPTPEGEKVGEDVEAPTNDELVQMEADRAEEEAEAAAQAEPPKPAGNKAAADKLRKVAESLKERAEESSGRDRLANTHRRARMAASAEAEARAQLRIAETMLKIADALERGELKALAKVGSRADVETLDSILRQAVFKADRHKPYHGDEERRRAPTVDDIQHAVYPWPHPHRANIKSVLEQLPQNPLRKKAERRFGGTGDTWIELNSDDDIALMREVIALARKKAVRSYDLKALDGSLANYGRMQRMGIGNAAELHTALREYIELRAAQKGENKIKRLLRDLIGIKIDGYFPTPPALVERMTQLADIKAGDKVAEPSAGTGNIADGLVEAGAKDLTTIEVVPRLVEVLKAKGYQPITDSFLDHTGEYDKIVMNPPFEGGQDIDHVRHAYELLKPGGRVVAIMSEGPFFRQDKKATAFRDWLDDLNGTSEKNPEGAFTSGERPTGVATRLVTIDKPTGVRFQQGFSDRSGDQYSLRLEMPNASAPRPEEPPAGGVAARESEGRPGFESSAVAPSSAGRPSLIVEDTIDGRTVRYTLPDLLHMRLLEYGIARDAGRRRPQERNALFTAFKPLIVENFSKPADLEQLARDYLDNLRETARDRKLSTVEADLVVEPDLQTDYWREKVIAGRKGGSLYQAAPVAARLTGDELGTDLPIRQLRQKALAWYRENLVGKSVVNRATGREIGFDNVGAKKTVWSRGEDLIRAVPALRQMLETAEYRGSETDRTGRPDLRNWHTFASAVEIGGKRLDVIMHVRELADGSYHYSLHKEDVGRPSLQTTMDRSPRAVGFPALEGPADAELNISPAKPDSKVRAGEAAARPDPQDVVVKPVAEGMIGIYRLAPELASRRVEIEQAAQDLVRRMTGTIAPELRLADSLRLENPEIPMQIFGVYSPLEHLIAVALDSPDPIGTVRHETVHVLRKLRLIGERDWKILSQAARDRGWLAKHNINWRYLNLNEEARIEEAIADEFGARGARVEDSMVRAIFGRIETFFRRLRAAIRRMIGRPVDFGDIFTAIERGDLATKEQIREPHSEVLAARARAFAEAADAHAAMVGESASEKKAAELRFALGTLHRSVAPDRARPLPFDPDLRGFQKWMIHPRTIAAMFPAFTPVWNAGVKQFATRDRIAAELIRLKEPYDELSLAEKANVNKALELGRLQGQTFRPDASGRILARNTVGALGSRSIGGAALTKAGETVTLSADEAQAYLAVRKTMDRALELFRDQMLVDWGFDPAAPGTPKTAREFESNSQQASDAGDPVEAERLGKIANVLAEIEMARKRGYVPFTRFGQWYVTVRSGDSDIVHREHFEVPGGEWRGPVGALQRRRWSEKIETRRRELMKMYPRSGGFTVSRPNRVTPKTFDELPSLSDISGLLAAAHLDTATARKVEEAVDRVIKEMGFKKHFIHARNVAGYSSDFDRTLADYVTGLAGYLGRRAARDDFEDALARVPETASKLKRYALDWHEYLQNPREEWARLRQAGFMYYLAGRVSSAAVNLSQVPVVTMPYLSQFADPARVNWHLGRAYTDLSKMLSIDAAKKLTVFDPDKAPADVRDDLKKAFADGTLVPLETFQEMAKAHGRTPQGRRFNRAARKAMDLAALAFSAAERVNRIATFMAAHRLARMPGVMAKAKQVLASNELWASSDEWKTPAGFAKWASDETHYVMGKLNRPTFMRGPGSLIFQFRGFTANTLELFWRMGFMHEGAAGKSALALSALMLLVFGGLFGLPGADDLKDLAEYIQKGITGKDVDLERELRDLAGGGLPGRIVARGPAREAMGVDLSRRIGMGDVVPQMGFGDDPLRQVAPLLGVPFDLLVMRPLDAATALGRGDAVGASIRALPEALADPLRAAQWAERGAIARSTGRKIIDRDQTLPTGETLRDPSNLAKRALGFQPTGVARAMEEYRAINRAGRAATDMVATFNTRLASSLVAEQRAETPEAKAKARADQQKILDEIERHNLTAPDHLKVVPFQKGRPSAGLRAALEREQFGSYATIEKRTPKKARGEVEAIRPLY